MRVFYFALSEGSTVYADKAYNDYEIEDWLLEAKNIKLLAMRKQNSKRPEAVYLQFLLNIVISVYSMNAKLRIPKTITTTVVIQIIKRLGR